MNALAVAPDGAPLGLCDQLWWVRDKPVTARPANRKGSHRGDVPTLGEAVRWIADIGGYTGKSSGGPPGAKVIARGFKRAEALAEGLRNIRELKM